MNGARDYSFRSIIISKAKDSTGENYMTSKTEKLQKFGLTINTNMSIEEFCRNFLSTRNWEVSVFCAFLYD